MAAVTAPGVVNVDWPAPESIRAHVTTRLGGVSAAPWDSLNLGMHVGDDPRHVAENRRRVAAALGLPAEPVWIDQVHGARVVAAESALQPAKADASVARRPGVVCAVMTADCLPVLFCAEDGSEVAAAHAGWRGLAAGVLEATVGAMRAESDRIMAWLGPAIGPTAFEVGDEVREVFLAAHGEAAEAFSRNRPGHWLADIYRLARIRLAGAGVTRIFGGEHCTYTEGDLFYSYRRDGVTGRMASLIWMQR